MMRKTKIVCTLGPATDGEGILRKMDPLTPEARKVQERLESEG